MYKYIGLTADVRTGKSFQRLYVYINMYRLLLYYIGLNTNQKYCIEDSEDDLLD